MTTHSSKGKLLIKEGQFEHYKKLIQFSYVTFHFEVLRQLYQVQKSLVCFIGKKYNRFLSYISVN